MNQFTDKDISGTKRGRCKATSCFCEKFLTKPNEPSPCLVCGCFAGKHEIIADMKPQESTNEAPRRLSGESETPVTKVMTPTRVEEGSPRVEEGSPHGEDNFASIGDVVMMNKEVPMAEDTRKFVHLVSQLSPNKVVSLDVVNGALDLSDVAMKDLTEIDSQLNSPEMPDSQTLNEGSKRSPPAKDRFAIIPKPPLSIDLGERVKRDGLLAHEFHFNAEMGSYLLSLTNGDKPTANEMTNFCSQVIEYYPCFKSSLGKYPWSAFQSALSKHLINRRYNMTHPKGSGKRNVSAKFVKPSTLVSQPTEAPKQDHIEAGVNALKEISADTPPEEVKRLLKLTADARRASMIGDNKSLSPREAVEKWPFFRNVSYLACDFFIMLKITPEMFHEEILSFSNTLAKVLDETGTKPRDDLSFLLNMATLAERLKPTKYKTSAKVVTVLEAFQSLDCLTASEGEAPRLVINANNTESPQCFLIFDTVTVPVETPTLANCMAALLGAYYVFDIKFPAAYQNFLQILDKEVLKKRPIFKAKQVALNKFYREFNRMK